MADWRLLEGACTRGIYDNMKTAVDAVFVTAMGARSAPITGAPPHAILIAWGPRRYAQMCAHHLVEPVACTPAAALRGLLTASPPEIGSKASWPFPPRSPDRVSSRDRIEGLLAFPSAVS